MSKFKKVAVVGAGAWGSALSVILSKNVPEVCVWARETEVVDSVAGKRENAVFLPGVKIPDNVVFLSDPKPVLAGAEIVVWVVPIHFLSRTAEGFSGYISSGTFMVNAGKGIEIGSWRRPSEILKAVSPQGAAFGSIMGPNIACEVAKGGYAEDVLAMDSHLAAVEVAEAFCTDSFKVRPSDDVIGVEIGAALKNIVAGSRFLRRHEIGRKHKGYCNGAGISGNIPRCGFFGRLERFICQGVCHFGRCFDHLHKPGFTQSDNWSIFGRGQIRRRGKGNA